MRVEMHSVIRTYTLWLYLNNTLFVHQNYNSHVQFDILTAISESAATTSRNCLSVNNLPALDISFAHIMQNTDLTNLRVSS